MDKVLEQDLAGSSRGATGRLIVNGCGDDVGTWDEEELRDIGGSDSLSLKSGGPESARDRDGQTLSTHLEGEAEGD